MTKGIQTSFHFVQLILIGLLVTGTAYSQSESSTTEPGVEILKLKWEKQVRLPGNFDPSAIPTGTTFNGPRLATEPTTNSRVASNSRNPYLGTDALGFPPVPGRMPVFYTYSIRVRNLGQKTIEGIAWDYVFFDLSTQKERGRHSFLSYEELTENKTVALKAQLTSPPVRVVQTPHTGQKKQSGFRGQATIQCVLYSDDSVWKNPSAPVGICALLQTERSVLKHKKK